MQETMRDAVLLVLADKQDAPGAMDAAEVADRLILRKLCRQRWFAFWHTISPSV